MAMNNILLKLLFFLQLLFCIAHSLELQSNQQSKASSGLSDSSDFSFPKVLWKFLRNKQTLQSVLKKDPSKYASQLMKLEGYDGIAKMLKKLSGQGNVSVDSSNNVLNFTKFKQLGNSSNTMLSNSCRSAMDDLFKLLLDKKYKKIEQLLDAMGKPSSGVYQGNFLWLGSYQECQATDGSHYCLSLIGAGGMKAMLGLCMPKDCNEEDTYQALQIIASATHKATASRVALEVDPLNTLKTTYGSHVKCQKKNTYSSGSLIAFAITALFGFLVVIGTFLDYFVGGQKSRNLYVSKSNGFMPIDPVNQTSTSTLENHDEQPLLAQNDVKKGRNLPIDIVLCFSLRKNAKAILSTDIPANAITSLNGIRTLSMFWVILGHTFFFALNEIDNIIQGFKIVHRFSFQAVANAYFSVDTFFVLSGLLVSYLCLKRFDNFNGNSFMKYFGLKFLPLYYLHRFLRLTPSYMYVILFYIFISPYCGEGPLWFEQSQGPGMTYCKKYWWTNLLYINNFYPTSMGEECIGWSWYLANDMQFYVISPAILLVMYKLGLPGTVIINGIVCVLSFIATGLIIGTQHLNSLLTGDFQAAGMGTQAAHFADWVYSKPYCRIPPYLIGLALGYLLYNRKAPRGNSKYVIGIMGWLAAVAIGLLVTYGPYTVFKTGGRPFNEAENVLYGTFSRFAWGLCVAWVIYACHFKMAGFINSILSWKAFIPLSRLTYSAYLVHPIVIYVFYFSSETPLHFADVSIAYFYASFILMTYAAAFLLSACVEFPALNLEKLVFRF